MLFIFGYIAGIVTAGLIFAILAFFRPSIEQIAKLVETRTQEMRRATGMTQKGAIFVPEDEAEIVRKEHIAKNKAEGKDTNIQELM